MLLFLLAGTMRAGNYITDYDDGENIYINVKIAIDRKGWEEKTPEYFVSELRTQWEQINHRFNFCDKKGDLKRTYHFEPDLEDIIVYEGCSYWGENGADRKVISQMDTILFKLVVIYDFFYEGEEAGEYGGGCGDYNGIGTILVINGSEGMKNKFNNHFDEYTYRAITHELGHFRGMIDLYTHVVLPENDPFTQKGFEPPSCLMGKHTYTPEEEAEWSDYAVKVINRSGNIRQPGLIGYLMHTDFADKIEIDLRKKEKPVSGTVRFYPVRYSYETWSNTVDETFVLELNLTDGKHTLDARSLFYGENIHRRKHHVLLMEAEVQGEKRYEWITDFLVHDCGMDGNAVYPVVFEF